MAFIGLFVVNIALIALILFLGIMPIVIGTILIHKTKYKKVGIALRIFGYVVLVPLALTAIIFIVIGMVK